jgi:hypothetical protein
MMEVTNSLKYSGKSHLGWSSEQAGRNVSERWAGHRQLENETDEVLGRDCGYNRVCALTRVRRMNEVTRILNAIDQGDRQAAEQLLPLLYEELRKLAAQRLAQERPGQTLQATALVHEAYLKLLGTSGVFPVQCPGQISRGNLVSLPAYQTPACLLSVPVKARWHRSSTLTKATAYIALVKNVLSLPRRGMRHQSSTIETTAACVARILCKPRSSLLREGLDPCYYSSMTVPPTYNLRDLGPQAQMMSRNCNNERLAMILQYVALGSMIVMTGIAASQVLRDAFGTHNHERGRSRWARRPAFTEFRVEFHLSTDRHIVRAIPSATRIADSWIPLPQLLGLSGVAESKSRHHLSDPPRQRSIDACDALA